MNELLQAYAEARERANSAPYALGRAALNRIDDRMFFAARDYAHAVGVRGGWGDYLRAADAAIAKAEGQQ
jgi:hypothetical protein